MALFRASTKGQKGEQKPHLAVFSYLTYSIFQTVSLGTWASKAKKQGQSHKAIRPPLLRLLSSSLECALTRWRWALCSG
jgi:hypothetical protein